MTKNLHEDNEQVLMEHDPDTTGHSWDGIKEFNNPLPRWWLWTFYATIVWALIYTVLYPAWPGINGATAGVLGYSTRGEVATEIAAVEEATAPLRAALVEADLGAVTPEGNPELYSFAVQGGASIFASWCSQCHGAGAAGVQASGYPNLLDDDWLWGGTIEDIHLTVAHGIRNETDPEARFSQMTAFDGMLSDEEIEAVVQHVISISGQQVAEGADLAMGSEVYLNNCAACHMDGGEGDIYLGAPNLTDAIWLYGGSPEAIEETVRHARYGLMPAWSDRLSEAEIRAVSIWVHAQGGGE